MTKRVPRLSEANKQPANLPRVPADCPTPKAHSGGCNAHRTKNGDGACCRAKAIVGTSTCRHHGGSAPQVRKAGARRALDARAASVLVRHGRSANVDAPLDELLKVGAEALAMKDAVLELVELLPTAEWRYMDQGGREQLRSEVELLERAFDRAVKTLSDIVRLGIEDRLARVSEVQTAALIVTLQAILGDLGEDPEGDRVAQAIDRGLRVLR